MLERCDLLDLMRWKDDSTIYLSGINKRGESTSYRLIDLIDKDREYQILTFDILRREYMLERVKKGEWNRYSIAMINPGKEGK